MNELFTFAPTIILILFCFYHRIASFLALSIASIVFFSLIFLNDVSPLWIIPYAILCGILFIPAIRQVLITKTVFKIFNNTLPPISSTERQAIDAGTVWLDAELFRGKPDWKKFTDIKAPQLSQEEQDFLDGPVNELCAMANDFQITHELADLPPDMWQFIKDNKFFAMIIKKKYGGLDFSAYAQALVLQKISGVSGALSSTVAVPNSLGPGKLLQYYGTEEQKNHYLPRLAAGKEIPCFALTSPEAGSDAGAIPDYGIVCKGQWQGEEVLGMRLTWNKRYITLAPIATVLGLAFKLKDPDGLLGDNPNIGMTCALIPTNTEGVIIGRRHFQLNIPFQNGPTQGNDVFVPLDFIIGGPKMAGQGWRMLVECLSVGRAISLPSNATGATKMAALSTGAYAKIRRQFKLPIGTMEGIEEPLARLAGISYMMDGANQLTMMGIDMGEKPSVISAIVKYYCTHQRQRCSIDAMDIAGGKGVCMGPSNFLARGYQGAAIGITVEGANILTRSMIIYGQGAIRCHPYIFDEMDAAHSTSENALAQFDKAVTGHIGFAVSNAVRSLWLGLVDGIGSNAPTAEQTKLDPKLHKQIKRYYQKLNRYSANMALLSDAAMASFGGELKRKERISARLSDVLTQLYFSVSALKRFETEGGHADDLPLVHWSVQDSLLKIENAIDEILNNLPSRSFAYLLRTITLPLGRVRQAPSDKLDHQLAQLLQTPSATRDRLGRNQYLEPTEHNPAGKIERALQVITEADPIFTKICKAYKRRLTFTQLDKLAEKALAENIITAGEADILSSAEKYRLETINVDDFAPEELAANKG